MGREIIRIIFKIQKKEDELQPAIKYVTEKV
jgi:hypothetical protein